MHVNAEIIDGLTVLVANILFWIYALGKFNQKNEDTLRTIQEWQCEHIDKVHRGMERKIESMDKESDRLRYEVNELKIKHGEIKIDLDWLKKAVVSVHTAVEDVKKMLIQENREKKC